MDRRLRDELDEVKLEAEKLREECRAKTELYHSLKKIQAEQLAKSQQDRLEIDKLARELTTKSEEICEIRKMCEDLQSTLQRKDTFLQQISSANEKLRAECGEKISKLETENRDLVLSLDEALSRIRDLEEKTNSSSEEIAGLKRLLLTKPEKRSEVSKDLKQREEYIMNLEEENRVSQEQLKWKNERFSHLEEAHDQVRNRFQASKIEWEKEKSALVDEISNLQADLDAQVRVSKNLETQLRVSNQTLAGEESRRRVLEIELSECRSRFEDVSSDYQVAKSEVERLTVKRDEEIGELRMLLRKKDVLDNEKKFKTEQLERENSELLVSLKEIREAEISSNAMLASSKKLRNKLEGLEKLHSKCGLNLKEKENEWNSRVEKLKVDLKNCLSELGCRNKIIRELQEEVDDRQCLLEIKDEEISTLFFVLKSEFYVAYSEVFDAEERMKSDFSALDSLKQKNNVMDEQLESCKAMLDESKCEVKILKLILEEIQGALEREKTARLAVIKDEDGEIGKLQENVCQLESIILEKSEAQEMLNHEKDSYIRLAEDRHCSIKSLQSEIDQLKNELASNIAVLDSHITLEQEKNKRFLSDIKEKDKKIQELEEHITLEQEKNKRFWSDIKEKDRKIQELEEELESFVAKKKLMFDEALKTSLEIEEKKRVIMDLEKDVSCLRSEVKFQGNLVIQSKQEVLQLEASLQTTTSEVQEVKSQLLEHEFHKRTFLEELRMASVEKESLLAQLEGIRGKIGIFCDEDVELAGMLDKMLHICEEDNEQGDGVDEITTVSLLRKPVQASLDGRTPLTELNC